MAENIVPNAAITATTINDHIRKITQPYVLKQPILAMMREKGRLEFNCSGKAFDWRVEMRVREPVAHVPNRIRFAPEVNRFKVAELPYRACTLAESVDEFTILANRSAPALANIVKTMTESLTKGMTHGLARRIYNNDGNAATTDDDMHGLPSCLGVGSAISGTPAYAPDDTYAGLSTVLENYGGDAETFPEGLVCDPEARFWSPLLIGSDSAALGGTAQTWAIQWKAALVYATNYMRIMTGSVPDMYAMAPARHLAVKNALSSEAVLNIYRGKDSSLAVKLGFTDIEVEGVPLVSDALVPDGVCYGIVTDNLQLRCMYSQLFQKDSDDDLLLGKTAYVLKHYGNLRIETPAKLAEIKDRAA